MQGINVFQGKISDSIIFTNTLKINNKDDIQITNINDDIYKIEDDDIQTLLRSLLTESNGIMRLGYCVNRQPMAFASLSSAVPT